ncbi:RluA family pseudouridine synthase [Variovorax ginsengisoli]|uniref:tRNA pseudouridine32 synthase/23S rRNA pseudouridine746 synthase n=1 Tax=Variovorax ginsengisoli TaxID=363844 RepID=A0ABT9S7D8_9BURK|nr:RluA family pseudouridine synthase [Variovorax ginsengisoli]MDP9899257.1 tRNA pseudouridine32 synthase/23S rRNA pseudouridine746 synthase [Variovorax ginsengisoli]
MQILPLQLHHEDAHLLVLDKPAGLLCVPGRGEDKQDCLSARALSRWPDALVVHRLDMATSGLVLMARHPEAQRALGDAFARREVFKRYEAIVDGQPPRSGMREDHAWSEIDLPLMADWPRRPMQKTDPAGKPSLTRWRLLEPLPERGCSRLLLEPRTGRTHQLRVHLAAIGHPILGDALYGDARVEQAADRLLLHASVLQLRHPVSGQALRFESAVPF